MQGKTNSKPFIEKVFTDKITITKPGKYVPTSDYVGFDEVTVDIPLINNQNLDISKNGTYTFDENYTGLGTVNVNVNKYGATIDNFLGDVDENGVLQSVNKALDIDFTGIKEVGENALKDAFKGKQINSINTSDIEKINSYGFNSTFEGSAYNGDGIIFEKLKEIVGNNQFYYCFRSSYFKIPFLSFPVLKELGNKNRYVVRCFNSTVSDSNCAWYFPELESIYGIDIFSYMGGIIPVFSKLKYVEQPTNSGGGALGSIFGQYTGTSYEFPALEEVGPKGLSSLLGANKTIQTVLFPRLHTIRSKGLHRWNTTSSVKHALTRMDFPSLINVEIDSFGISSYLTFENCPELLEIHFRADMQEKISTLTGYAEKFGATNATIYFDL